MYSRALPLLKVGVLVSGRGSNLLALLRVQKAGGLGAEIVLVVSNHPGVPALDTSALFGVPASVCDAKTFGGRARAQAEASRLFRERGVELVVLAGYDRILAPAFVSEWEGRVMNIHPSLLPAFGGSLHSQREAVEYGVRVSGCTVHFVTGDVDGGPIIFQAAVPVYQEDDVETLSRRILAQEHELLPLAVRAYADGRLRMRGRRVFVEEG